MAAESKTKKKLEKESTKFKDECEELRKVIRELELCDERRSREAEESRSRAEKENREKLRQYDREMEELQAKLQKEATENRTLVIQLEEERRKNAEREKVTSEDRTLELKRVKEENERLRETIGQMEHQMETSEAEYEAKIMALHRDLERMRLLPSFPCAPS